MNEARIQNTKPDQAALEDQIDELTERVAKLEGQVTKPQKTLFEVIAIRGGLLALAISIITGAYTIIDISFLQRERELIAFEASTRAKLDELSALNSELAEIGVSGNLLRFQTAMNSASPRRLGLIQTIHSAYSEAPNIFNTADHMMLANEFASFQMPELALEHANEALSSAEQDIAIASAHTLVASLHSTPGPNFSVDAARSNYEAAVQIYENQAPEMYLQSLIYARTYYLGFEYNVTKDCGRGEMILSKIGADMNSGIFNSAGYRFMAEYLTQNKMSYAGPCQFDLGFLNQELVDRAVSAQ